MAFHQWVSSYHDGYHEIDSGFDLGMTPPLSGPTIRRKPPLNNDDHEAPYQTISRPTYFPSQSIGKPTTKKRLYLRHVLVLASSTFCLILGICSIANEGISWRLGVIRQLIVIGFLLSIMNLNLGSVSPIFFTLLEARFGKSKIQNYDGILRAEPWTNRLSLYWRFILTSMLALPLGLSVAYKTFVGGFSEMPVSAVDFTGNISTSYGMFGPPGLQSNTGVTLFTNATLPFVAASTAKNGGEPELPPFPQAYGFNILLLDKNTAAMLDVPHPDYIAEIQSSLKAGESLTVAAPVFGTVAKHNETKQKDTDTCLQYYEDAYRSSGALTYNSLMNYRTVALVNHPSPGPQDVQYIAITTDQGISYYPRPKDFCRDAYTYDVTRQNCQANWSISPNNYQLVSGSCNNTMLESNKQLIITDNELFIGVWYMSALAEFLQPFSISRKNSLWEAPSMTVAIAAAVWSRITVINAEDINIIRPMVKHNLTTEQLGILYHLEDTAKHIRPTLRKSPWLYCIMSIPLILTASMLIYMACLASVPLSPGFSMISVLAGVDAKSLQILKGASLSGNLTRDVFVRIQPEEFSHELNSRNCRLGYTLTTTLNPKQQNGNNGVRWARSGNSPLVHGVEYH